MIQEFYYVGNLIHLGFELDTFILPHVKSNRGGNIIIIATAVAGY